MKRIVFVLVFFILQVAFAGQNTEKLFSGQSPNDLGLDSELEHLKISANSGDEDAINRLASMYALGQGVVKNFAKAHKLLLKGSTQGNAQSQAFVALNYMEGLGADKDYDKAIYWAKKSSDNGFEFGRLVLADIYANGYGVSRDYKKAFDIYLELSRSSRPSIKSAAVANLADYYYTGLGTKIDYSEAFKWYLSASEFGNIRAQGQIGLMLQNGEGVGKDAVKALVWYKKSAEKGDVISIRNLGIAYEFGQGTKINIKKAIALYKKAAELGSGSAMFNLAVLYENNKDWKDIRQSFSWYLKSSEAGYYPAYALTGFNYTDGYGVEKDVGQAIYWLYKSYNAEDVDSPIYTLLDLYLTHKNTPLNFTKIPEEVVYQELIPKLTKKEKDVLFGIHPYIVNKLFSEDWLDELDSKTIWQLANYAENQGKDLNLTLKLYEMSASKGDSLSMVNLGRLYGSYGDSSLPIDITKSEYWYKEAVKHGSVESLAYLGIMYRFEVDALGVKNELFNPEKSFKLLKEAYEKGVVFSTASLASAYIDGIGTKKNLLRGVELLKEEMHSEKTTPDRATDILFDIFEIQLENNLLTSDITSVALLKMEGLANSGDSERQVGLANVYLNKNFPGMDVGKAIFWLEKASNRNIVANTILMTVYGGSYDPSYMDLKKMVNYSFKTVDLFESKLADDYDFYKKYSLESQVHMYQGAARFYAQKGMNDMAESLIRKASEIHLGSKAVKLGSARNSILASLATDSQGLENGHLNTINDSSSQIWDVFSAIDILSRIYQEKGRWKKSIDVLTSNVGKVAGFDPISGQNIDLAPHLMLVVAQRYLEQENPTKAREFFEKYKGSGKNYPEIYRSILNATEQGMENIVDGYLNLLSGKFDTAYEKIKKGVDGYLRMSAGIKSEHLIFATRPMHIFLENEEYEYAYKLARPLITAYKRNFNHRLNKGVKISDKEKQAIKNILSDFIFAAERSNNTLLNFGFETMQLSAGLTASDALIKSIYQSQISQEASGLFDELNILKADKRLIIKEKIDSATLNGTKTIILNNKLNIIDREIKTIKSKISHKGFNSNDINLFISSAQDVINNLHRKDALLTMLVSDKRSVVWLATTQGIYVHHSNTGSDVIKDQVTRMLSSLDPNKNGSEEFPLEVAEKLYDLLIRPFEKELEGIDRLVIAPDSTLSGIPFSILSDVKGTGQNGKINYINPLSVRGIGGMHANPMASSGHKNNWLINKYAISIVPSIYSYVKSTDVSNIKKGLENGFIGIGNPILSGNLKRVNKNQLAEFVNTRGSISKFVGEMAPLPETEQELSLIAKTFKKSSLVFGINATEKKIRELDLSQYSVISFATHALVSNEIEGVVEPSLILTPVDESDPANDGLLTAAEISSLKLNADIVLLSACNTASSFGDSNSQGLSGLANSFFDAGAKSLLVSYWSIISESAVDITTRIFKPSNAGRSYAHKHRSAVLDLLNTSKDLYKGHPSYWAPFSVIGTN